MVKASVMIVRIDSRSPVPVFEQLRTQIQRLIASGQLCPGTKLPTIRRLASDLGLARGTVNKVYDRLAEDGLVSTSGRLGTTVLALPINLNSSLDLSHAADTLAVVARQLGLDPQVAHRALDEAFSRH
jgi:GntR family transcriptional regulator